MKLFVKIAISIVIALPPLVFAATKENLSVDKIEIYSDKTKISDLGSNGFNIPANTKLVVFRTNNPTYATWKFVAYGNSMSESLSILLTAKATSKSVSCVWEDRGNFWVECVGLVLE